MKIYHGWTLYFLSVENSNSKRLICNRQLRKREQVQKWSSKGWENFISISKSGTNVKFKSIVTTAT